MKPKIIAAAAVAAVVATFASGALAQFESTDTSPLGVGITIFRPSGTELKDLNDNWLGATLQLHAKRDELGRPTALFSLGWFAADKTGGRASFVPVGFTMVKRFGVGETCWYVSGGLDVFFAHYEGVGLDPASFQYAWMSDNGTKFGYNLAFGREFGAGWFVEAKRDSIAKLSLKSGGSVDFSGWSITIGSRLAY